MSKTEASARDLELLSGSSFFQRTWYLARHPDVAAAGIDPVEHYLHHGAREGRNPGPAFDTRAYLRKRPDVARAKVNPLAHFLRYGLAEMALDGPREAVEALVSAGVDLRAPPRPQHLAQRKAGPKAVFVTHDANIGGAPAVLASIADWFQRHTDYDVRIVSMAGGPRIAALQAIAPTFVVGHLRIPESSLPERQDALRAFIGGEPAFVFINSVAAGGYCAIHPYSGTPVLAYIHELEAILGHFTDELAAIIERADHIFCDGDRVRTALRSLVEVDDANLSVRPAFIPHPERGRFLDAADKAELRQTLGWPETAKVVLGCGVVHWRKQPEVFVRMAASLAGTAGLDARFVWIGDGDDLPRVKELAAALGVAERVRFLGHQDDYRRYFQAADVFALTSSEDPFPLVCLEAAIASAPSVIFREAGGMTALVEPEGDAPGGVAVPLNDEAAFAHAVLDLLTNDRRREELARTARDRALVLFTGDKACADILRTVRRVAGLAPRVSVVVPNYNYERYLQQRLDSIAGQSFKDVEILLLDDASTDNSRDVLSAFADQHPDARLLLAETNGGSVFRAWERGLAAASGDLVWIAEADDWCEPTFLEEVVRAFRTSGVRLAYGCSIPVNDLGEIAGDYNELYLDRIAKGRWRRSFCEPAAKEVNLSLGRANSIPNASAVVVRRSAGLRAIAAARALSLAGDWAFYLTAIAGGRIAYVHEAVNYHRRHERTVTRSIEGKEQYFAELANIGALVRALYGENAAREAAFRAFVDEEVRRFRYEGPVPEGRVPAELEIPAAPGILYGVGDLSGGGAQMFAIRFVNGWAKDGAPAVLFVVGHEPDQPELRARVSPDVPVVSWGEVMAVGLQQFMEDWGLRVVITGHWWADRAVGAAMERAEAPPPWVIVMHGCYENVLANLESYPAMREEFGRAARHCDQWIWTAAKNRTVFEEGHIEPRRTRNIANGFEPVEPSGLTRAELGIPEDALVFTLASRAIAEKGWRVAVEAFRGLRSRHRGARDLRLQLIGDGPVAAELRAGAPIEGLHLVPYTSRLADYISVSDLCLLPSWFAGESLPLVLIEFLAQGKPAIVSDIGMCPWAIDSGAEDGAAGLVVPRSREGGTVTAHDLAAAMKRFVQDPHLARSLAPAAHRAFRKFDFQQMLAEYRQVVDHLLAERAGADPGLSGTHEV